MGSSASEAAEARLKSTDNGDKNPSAHSDRLRDTYRPFLSICLEGRGYGTFIEGASNDPYAGSRYQEDTKPCAGEDDRAEIDGEGEEESCPIDELETLMTQEVPTYSKGLKGIEDV